MKNEPYNEPYYNELIKLGYLPFNYSEKHYIFTKGDRIIKIARSAYNSTSIDESYYIEKKAHEILNTNGLNAVKVSNIYRKDELVDDFTVLEEERADGQIFYKKNSDENVLGSILSFMEDASQIKSEFYGMMDKNGEAKYSSWKAFLRSVINKSSAKDREQLECALNRVADIPQSCFVMTDCNTANFVFENGKLKYAFDVERPLWGDKNFLYAVIKARNPYMFERIKNRIKPISGLIDFYCKIYDLIFS